MPDRKRVKRAWTAIENLKNFVLVVAAFGFILVAWAAINYGFDSGAMLWFCAFLAGAAFWFGFERFPSHLSRRLLSVLAAVVVAFAALSVAAAFVSSAAWGDYAWAANAGIVLSVVLVLLMLRIIYLGRIVVPHVAEPTGPAVRRGRQAIEAPVPQECPSCGRIVDAGTASCPTCGSSLSGQ